MSIEEFVREVEAFTAEICDEADREAEAINRLATSIEQATAQQQRIINRLNQAI